MGPALLGSGHSVPRGSSDKGRKAFAARCRGAYIPACLGTDVIGVLVDDRDELCPIEPVQLEHAPPVRIRQISLQPGKPNDQCQYFPE